MIQSASKYAPLPKQKAPVGHDVRSGRLVTSSPTSPNLLLKKLAKAQSFRDWWFREIKDGGFLHGYVAREKHGMKDRFRAIARKLAGWRQPTKTDFQLRAAIPARLYHRLKQEDPHFFEDNRNLKNLKRDNDEVFIKV